MSRVPHTDVTRRADPLEVAMRPVRWVVAGLLLGALAAFVAEMLRPRPAAVGSGYNAPVPSRDHRVVLPR